MSVKLDTKIFLAELTVLCFVVLTIDSRWENHDGAL